MLKINHSPIHRPTTLVNRPACGGPEGCSHAAPELPGESSQLSSVPARIASVSPAAVAQVESELAGHEFVDGELLVKLKGGGMEAGLQDNFASEYGAQVVERFDIPDSIFQSFGGDLIRIKLPHGISPAEAMAAMKDDGRVAYAEVNDIVTLDEAAGQNEGESDLPNDLDEKLWGLHNTGQRGGTAGADVSAVEAWETTVGTRNGEGGPLIAVIDTGADYNHPDLAANIWTNPGEIAGDGIDNDGNGVIDDVHGYNAYADSGDPMDGHSHGTHCSGTIAGVGNNGEGVTGVMQQATVLPIKIFSDSGRTTADAIVRGILYATAQGADITSNSWGGGRANNAIRDAFANSPALHIAAAGNSNSDNDRRPHYPSNYELPNMVAVAATNRNDNRASFSCYGETTVDVAAPGRDIWSTIPGGRYGNKSGTSMATPHVSGVAGLIASAHPDASNEEIKSRLIYSSDKVDSLDNVSVSDGRVNAARSLETDNEAPAAPHDFQAVSTDSRGTVLSWTASGDDGWCGDVASGFEVRMSNEPITPENFAQAQSVPVAVTGTIGDIQSFSYGLEPRTEEGDVHFAMQAIDNVGNRSELRTTTVSVPAVSVTFADTFDGEESAWTQEGSWGRVAVEGRGQVWTDSPDGNYGDESSTGLTSPTISLAGKKNAFLTFDSKQTLSWGDSVKVLVKEEGSDEWISLVDLPRRQDWTESNVDLAEFSGKDIQVRFQLDSNARTNNDGIYIDNFTVVAENA